MKKLILFSLLIIFYNLFPRTIAQNLIKNSNFDTVQNISENAQYEKPFFFEKVNNWFQAQGTPQLWIRNKYTLFAVNVIPHSGDVVAYMVADYLQNSGTNSNYCSEGIFQNISMVACNSYKLSFWVRNPSTSNITLSDFYIAAANGLINNPDGGCNVPQNISDSMVIFHGKNIAPGNWQYFETTFIPKKDYSQFWIYPKHSGIQTAQFTIDDIYLEAIPISISALDGETFCNNINYRFNLSNLPEGTDVSWSKSDNLEIVSGTDSSIFTVKVLNPGAYGTAWIQAIYIGPCGPVTLGKKYVWIGKPSITSNPPLAYYNGSIYNNACNEQTFITNMTVLGAPSTTWTRIAANPSNAAWYQSGVNINFYFYNLNQTAVFRISASNTCGTISYDFGFKSVNCGYDPCNPQYLVSPNPASDFVVITPDIPAPCDENLSMNASAGEYIKLYDKNGTLKKQKKYKFNTHAEIDLQDLDNGFYIIEIYDGLSVVKKNLIVQH